MEAAYETRVPGNIFAASLSDDFVLSGPDYPDKDDPPGWIWGTRWSCAYPGLEYIADGSRASAWAQRLGRPMHEVNLETNAFQLRLVFADVRYHFEGYDVQREVLGPKQYPLPILDDDVTSDEGVR